LMQWAVTAAKIDGMRCNQLQRLCKFLCFVCAFTMDVSLPHPTVKRRFLVSKSVIKKLVLIYIHKKDQKISTLQLLIAHLSCSPVMFSFLSCSLWRHIYHTRAGTCAHVHLFLVGAICHVLLSRSPFCHVLSGAISIIRELVLVRMYTFSGWRHLSCSPVMFSCHVLLFVMFSLADTKTWRDTSTSSTHHHDESLLL